MMRLHRVGTECTITVSIISDVLETWMLKFSENFPKK